MVNAVMNMYVEGKTKRRRRIKCLMEVLERKIIMYVKRL